MAVKAGVAGEELYFDESGKTTFVFRTEIVDEIKLQEFIEDATARFNITTDVYKIRVFSTSELIKRKGRSVNANFLTIKVEGINLRATALRISRVINYLTLLDFGIRSGESFEIEEDEKSIRLLQSAKSVEAKGILRRSQLNS